MPEKAGLQIVIGGPQAEKMAIEDWVYSLCRHKPSDLAADDGISLPLASALGIRFIRRAARTGMKSFGSSAGFIARLPTTLSTC
jgi:hypothetical protein